MSAPAAGKKRKSEQAGNSTSHIAYHPMSMWAEIKGAEWQALVEDNAARSHLKEDIEDFVKKQVSKLQASELHVKDDIKLKLGAWHYTASQPWL